MSIGSWQIIIVLSFFSPTIISLVLCLILIKKKNYKKPTKNKIYAGFWYRFLGWILMIFLYWLYFAIQHSSTSQATLGMKALDIKICSENQGKIGFWRASGNYFVSSLSAMLLFIGFFMIGFTARKQGLHNFISRTLYFKDK